MRTLLVITTGHSDVQLVIEGHRHKLDGDTCGTLHDAIKERSWSLVDAPSEKNRDLIKSLPAGGLSLCTPKLDAILTHLAHSLPTHALVFETTRQHERDPRLAGTVIEQRLRERGITQVTRVAFLTGDEKLEDRSNEIDAIVRRSVVATLSTAIGHLTEGLTPGDRVFVATTGGLPEANAVISELVRLHCVAGPTVTTLEVPDENRAGHDDRAVEEKFHPAAGYRARWHALSLVENGNFLAAWGAVSHLEGEPGQEWTRVIKWLANFAASLPQSPECDIPVLYHRYMAVRAALRVELALRAGDIPRAVHGTVAFLEAALWDHLGDRTLPHDTKHLFKFREPIANELVRERNPVGLSKTRQNSTRPFVIKETIDGEDWYSMDDSEICSLRAAKHYFKLAGLERLCKVVAGDIRQLRNDVAHTEPTPKLMQEARTRMQAASLWSSDDTFLSQPLVQDVLKELGEAEPKDLLVDLMAEVRRRLVPSAGRSAP